MTSFRQSLALNFLASSGATVVMFIVSLVVARILSPAEIGIYSIAIVLVNIAHVFRDFGVSSYLQRTDRLSRDEVRSALAVAYAIAWSVAALIFLLSDPVAGFFGYAAIGPVMRILAASFLFIPFSSVALALLLREFDAAKIAIGTAVGTAAYTVVAIGLALSDHGAASLAWANLANVVSTGLVYVALRPVHMAYLPRFSETGGILRFGTGALLTNLVVAGNAALPDLILGKIGSARAVGLLSRANSTVSIFMYVAGSAISFGSQTYLAKAHHAGESLQPLLHRAIALVTAIGWPMLAVTMIVAEDLVVGLYGETWLAAAPAIVPLALMAAIDLAFHYHTAAFNAIGRPYLAAFPLLSTALARIGLGLMLWSGDIVSFGWAMALASIFGAAIWLILQRRHLGCAVLPFARMVLPGALVALACALVAFGAQAAIGFAEIGWPLVRLMILAVPVGVVWLLTLWLLRHPLFDEIALLAGKLGLRIARPAAGAKA